MTGVGFEGSDSLMSYAVSTSMHAFLFLALTGCAADLDEAIDEQQSDLTQPTATITFASDFSHSVAGTLVAGTPVTIAYDAGRLTTCRGEKYGQPAWSIVAHYRVDGGPVMAHPVVSPQGSSTPMSFPSGGHIEMWFVNADVWGCVAYDSAYGQNFHFDVGSSSGVAWAGLASSVITRCSHQGEACEGEGTDLANGFVYGTWARQRALHADLTFEAWEPGVTDWDNPDAWMQLDVQMHYRFGTSGPFVSSYVDLQRRAGNNARYAVSLRDLDPLGGNTITEVQDCPAVPLSVSADPAYVETTVELFFTVNGFELRPSPGATYAGRFEDYAGLYAPCL